MTQLAAVATKVELPAPGTWALDPAHTSLSFVARHMVVTKVRGQFTESAGSITIAERPEDSSAEIAIKTASLDSGNADRDRHLKSPDFLDIETYPEITFRSTNVEITGDATLRVSGDLTIRDVTKPVVLDAEFAGLEKDPWGNARMGFSAATEIEREDWGMTWNVALESGGWLVSKKVKLEIDVEAILPKPDASDEGRFGRLREGPRRYSGT